MPPPAVKAEAQSTPSRTLLGLQPAVVITACLVLLYFLGTFLVMRVLIFDDSFITYRYAKNLASGFGITWNPHEAPVEGYTNFLLVLLLAPVIKLGIDPLAATRVFSLLAGAGIVCLLFLAARKLYGASGSAAALIALGFLLISRTHMLVMVGLETVLFGAAFFEAFLLGCRYLDSEKPRDAAWFGAAAFTALLLRPEAVFLVLAFAAVILARGLRTPGRAKVITVPAKMTALTFLLPLAAYLLWKYLHFGDLLPNPYYIKAAAPQLISRLGVITVQLFFQMFWILLPAAAASFWLAKGDRGQRAMGAIALLLYLAYYLHVEPLMDIEGRFLYPAAILLFFLALPAATAGFRKLEGLRWPGLLKSALACLLVVGVCNWKAPYETYFTLTKTAFAANNVRINNGLMQREDRLGKDLARYPGIERVRIAFGDAGVIPYHSGALHLDVVGLNDRVIPRVKDPDTLVDYFFDQQPDLVLQPVDANGAWFRDGHGPLGNYAAWAGDPRWDRYAYAGSVALPGAYNLHLLVRRDLSDAAAFAAFLRTDVVDGYFSELPLPLGSYRPLGQPVTWYQVRAQ